MRKFEERGNCIRAEAKALVYQYEQASDLCQPGRESLRLSPIFRACGFDWGEHEKATSSSQQYWVVAIMREKARLSASLCLVRGGSSEERFAF
ncbi:hypothetical protein [Caenimonas sp. SL110]|uniref:hypothetical protein n=1 Tax=Caenimonas sp. SL110 TaxID=1450524 RepID=UPI00069CDEE2|nr:hypothetical protein [Caenimonas sp. SL110]